jgi:demethylmenaquinone methyltransferase/2-methoxy-6-polyprenyl-1,4-benzoquinol methylase
MAPVMESSLRHRLSDPVTTLRGAGVRPGQKLLEVGCGTGFFTLHAAALVGDAGHMYALDVHPLAIEQVENKIRDAGVANVSLIKADATRTGLADGCIDVVLLLGVIPSPTLPLPRLLPEMIRLLKPQGTMAVWTAFPWWLPQSMTRCGLFTYAGKASGVHTFRRAQAE